MGEAISLAQRLQLRDPVGCAHVHGPYSPLHGGTQITWCMRLIGDIIMIRRATFMIMSCLDRELALELDELQLLS